MALEGTIRDFGLPDIFQLIGLQRKTGILTLKNEKDQVTVAFENGMVVAADSSTKRLEDRLGNVLVKQGKLTNERLADALSTQKATLQRLGHVLVTQNAITDKDLKEAITVQISQLVFKVFRWRDGEYHFAPTDTVDYDRENFAPMSADFILMEGIRMVDEWPIIEKKIPSMDIVFRTNVDPGTIEVTAGDPEGGSVKQSASASNKIRLSRDEERVFRKVDGTRTVQGIVDSSGLSEFDTCRILFDLLNRNLISPVGRGAKVAETSRREAVVSSTPGYVLAGVAVLLALAGISTRLSTPFAVTGLSPYLQSSYDLMLESARYNRLERLDRAVLAYHLAQGTTASTLGEVASRGLVDRSYLKDPWERPYHYALTATGYLLSAVDDAGKKIASTTIERALPLEKP